MAEQQSETVRTRTKPMVVLCLGLPRTGTTYLRQALKDLGIHDTYHYDSLFETPSDAERWCEAFDLKFGTGHGDPPKGLDWSTEKWDEILGDCMSVSDNPCITFAAELVKAYPDALVLLQTRDSADAWCKSYSATILPLDLAFHMPADTIWQKWQQVFEPYSAFLQFNRRLTKWNPIPTRSFHTEGRETYHRYNQNIRDMMKDKPDKFLEYNVKQGWEPLCAFLNKQAPRDEETGKVKPFPRLNDTAAFNKLWEGPQSAVYKTGWAPLIGAVGVLGMVTAVGIHGVRTGWLRKMISH